MPDREVEDIEYRATAALGNSAWSQSEVVNSKYSSYRAASKTVSPPGGCLRVRCNIGVLMPLRLATIRLPYLSSLLMIGLPLLVGCPTVDLGETPVSPGSCRPDPVYFEENIWPIFIDTGDMQTSCVGEGGCHQLENGRSAFRVSVAEPVDFTTNYNVTTRFLNCGTPSASALLTKPISGVDSHGGGDLFAPGSANETIFLDWFASP